MFLGVEETIRVQATMTWIKSASFGFQKKMRAKWIRVIPRQDLVVHDKTVVGKKHFSEQFIIRVDSVTRDDVTVLSLPRQRLKLTADAYPSLFPNTPLYLTSERVWK